MSTIKVNKIENTATADGGIAIDATGHVQVDGVQLPTAGALSNRNLIINGAMQVSQRGTSTTGVTTQGYYACDRVLIVPGALGTWTVEQSTDAPKGFSNSFKATCTTADSSPAAGDTLFLLYQIEGQDLQHLNYGTSDAQPLTISFWVKSNKTGDASFSCLQPDNSNRLFSTTYNIGVADTWEYKTITIPADTAGLINNDNGAGFRLDFWLNSGSTYTGGATQDWGAIVDANRNPSNLGVGGAVSDNFAITGIQLEVGEAATSFEHRSFGDELARCQRYYYQFTATAAGYKWGARYNATGSGQDFGQINWFPTQMRTDPTGTLIGTWDQVNCTGVSIGETAPSACFIRAETSGSGSATFYPNGADNGFKMDAEL